MELPQVICSQLVVFWCAFLRVLAEAKYGEFLCFPVMGDFGGTPFAPYSTFTQRKIASIMAKVVKNQNCQFILTVGDNFYYSGVKDVNDPRFHLTFERTYNAPALQLPWYLIAGNHDHVRNVSAQIAYSKKSHRWKFPSYYHSKVHKIPGSDSTVHIVMIDTTLLCWPKRSHAHEPTPDEQFSWIEDQLKHSVSDYLLVAGHHPILSAGLHGNSQCLIDRLQPMLERYHVNIYFSGHDHNLQHIDHNGVNYFVSGSGNFYNGIKMGIHRLPTNSLKHFSYHGGGFVVVKIDRDSMELNVINNSGRKAHRASFEKRNSTPSRGVQQIESLDGLDRILLTV